MSTDAVRLPPELWDHVISLVEPDHMQHVTLALMLSGLSISITNLYRHLCISRENQAWQVILQLLKHKNYVQYTKSFRALAWREDPQQLINLVLMLPQIRYLYLCVGPLFQPEHFDELLATPNPRLERFWLRFNPYVMERSYYTFLKGTYFDNVVEHLARWSQSNLTMLALEQDLPPNHNAKIKSTPIRKWALMSSTMKDAMANLSLSEDSSPFDSTAFNTDVSSGDQEEDDVGGVGDTLGDSGSADASGLGETNTDESNIPSEAVSPLNPAPATKPKHQFVDRRKKKPKELNFAQPIVFFKLMCIMTLATAPAGRRLEHLLLRLPRRNCVSVLGSMAVTQRPFESLTSLDLSTTVVLADAKLGQMLAVYPKLQYLTLDRVIGLLPPNLKDTLGNDQLQAIATLRMLGKVCACIGLTRADNALKEWRNITKLRADTRSDTVPELGLANIPARPRRQRRYNRSSFASAPRSMTTSLASSVASSVASSQNPSGRTSPESSTREEDKYATANTVQDTLILPPTPKLKALGLGIFDAIDSRTTELWTNTFNEGYHDGISQVQAKINEILSRWELWQRREKRQWQSTGVKPSAIRIVCFKESALCEEPATEDDVTFEQFCSRHGLVSLSDPTTLSQTLSSELVQKDFSICFTPDCSAEPGIPHLSLSTISKETVVEREAREKLIWAEEAGQRARWRKNSHLKDCAHSHTRSIWDL